MELQSLPLPCLLQSPVFGRGMNYNILSDMERNPIVGLRFYPTDYELVNKYLREKLDGVLIDCEDIPEIDIYNHEPFDLPNFSRKRPDDDLFYFFCAVTYMGKKAQSCKRITQAGFWKFTGRPRVVKHKKTKKEIGKKRTLVFHLGRGKGARTEWVMHEYKYTEKLSNGGGASKSNQGDFVLCKIKKKFDWKRGKSESSFNIPTSLVDQDEACDLVTSLGSDKSESSFNTSIFAKDEIDLSVVSFNKSEPSFNTNISFDFHNGNENLIMANVVAYGNETRHLVASVDRAKESSDFTNQIQEPLTADSAMSYEKADESESSFNASISSSFGSKETNSATYGDEDSYDVPSDLGNHMPDRRPSLIDDFTYFHPLDFEDQSVQTNHAICGKENQLPDSQLGDCHEKNYQTLLKYNFHEEFVQEGDSSQLILSSISGEHHQLLPFGCQ